MYGGVNDVNLNSVVVSRVRGLAVLKLLASDLERMPISEILSSQSLKLSLEFVSHIGNLYAKWRENSLGRFWIEH